MSQTKIQKLVKQTYGDLRLMKKHQQKLEVHMGATDT